MGKRFQEVVALGEVATQLGLENRLLFGFHPLGHDLHAKGVGELHDHPHDRRVPTSSPVPFAKELTILRASAGRRLR